MTKDSQFPKIAVRAIILNEVGEILLLKRAANDKMGNKWCLPGGKVDFGFSAEEALKKEIKEETNLDCLWIEFLFYLDWFPAEFYETHYITLYFQCSVSGDLHLNDESDEYHWSPWNDIKNYDITFGNDEALNIFHKSFI
jgi:8-oxo-dGTP diphosphatase